ncbi:MAG: MEDS domain-containing protein [Proteobacteria bacterium]|nr:MEDS domain-containing protein [Pseudomonadota bacterium]MBU1450904.1 MEDS domain-containing protein [Pseudomonadota bacterium]MBU2468723.1 MEDS domain-containing protein [Pseudomonadota bacterium]MBU2517171.1 MEDS domain-containing protein [Pseudomonadota bacterium]
MAYSRHRVLITDDPAQWRRVVRSFFREGLALGEPCLCLYSLVSRQSVCCFLEAVGVDAAAAQAQGALSFLSADQVFNQDGVFSPSTCLGALVKAGRSAVPHWGEPVRVVADMNWAADSRLNHLRLLVYEDLINRRLLPHFPVNLLCYYDRALFPPSFLDQVVARHRSQVPLQKPIGAGAVLSPPLNRGGKHLPGLAVL